MTSEANMSTTIQDITTQDIEDTKNTTKVRDESSLLDIPFNKEKVSDGTQVTSDTKEDTKEDTKVSNESPLSDETQITSDTISLPGYEYRKYENRYKCMRTEKIKSYLNYVLARIKDNVFPTFEMLIENHNMVHVEKAYGKFIISKKPSTRGYLVTFQS